MTIQAMRPQDGADVLFKRKPARGTMVASKGATWDGRGNQDETRYERGRTTKGSDRSARLDAASNPSKIVHIRIIKTHGDARKIDRPPTGFSQIVDYWPRAQVTPTNEMCRRT
jgi:hypothetical protein